MWGTPRSFVSKAWVQLDAPLLYLPAWKTIRRWPLLLGQPRLLQHTGWRTTIRGRLEAFQKAVFLSCLSPNYLFCSHRWLCFACVFIITAMELTPAGGREHAFLLPSPSQLSSPTSLPSDAEMKCWKPHTLQYMGRLKHSSENIIIYPCSISREQNLKQALLY